MYGTCVCSCVRASERIMGMFHETGVNMFFYIGYLIYLARRLTLASVRASRLECSGLSNIFIIVGQFLGHR